ncbi:MAG: hypothetical protein BGO45_03905 [Microbacterium sp. 71-36]|uniref:DUF3054 domain-containing protein n=1 Tax=unclassified Microbacterium TaxID=2609290 RepID=UPI00086B9350|nr:MULTISPECIES: DUF3054 domain-containing protein [unclassified Microbacterium]MBN9210854.1 DUF3054 domain-containing protein [Microbacterium sp.]ODT38756.1 MAG: hypothetical protein ABS60_09380 [Microbacterium sp. SCN 71-17]ODU51981.1 MAG: hypothetical protein ABT07_01745 [Microbacterium sp. SCN 70-10]OJV75651.1 MAG: hypothetical protein BGO45_03905 [Microbacterium sp. 71-36]
MTSRRSALLVLLVDVVLVVVFAAIGRATHDGDVLGPAGAGLATTAWPFLVGLLLGWAVSLGWRRPLAPLRTGLPVWGVTLVAGMLLRAVSGQGVAVAFVIVAGVTLLVFLVGWRAIAGLAARVRVSRSA